MTTQTRNKGKYTLEHSIIEDSLGQDKDCFEISFRNETGTTIRIPFHAPPRIWSDELPAIRPYSEEEYEEIFTKQIQKYENRN